MVSLYHVSPSPGQILDNTPEQILVDTTLHVINFPGDTNKIQSVILRTRLDDSMNSLDTTDEEIKSHIAMDLGNHHSQPVSYQTSFPPSDHAGNSKHVNPTFIVFAQLFISIETMQINKLNLKANQNPAPFLITLPPSLFKTFCKGGQHHEGFKSHKYTWISS